MIHRFFLFMMLVVFLAGSTGITYSFHSCLSSGKTDLKLFPEIFSQSPSCCCESASENSMPFNAYFSEPDCCKTTWGFIKTVFTGIPLNYHFDKILSVEFLCHNVSLSIIWHPEPLSTVLIPPDDHSPPLSGTSLIYFLHQIRIPFPVC